MKAPSPATWARPWILAAFAVNFSLPTFSGLLGLSAWEISAFGHLVLDACLFVVVPCLTLTLLLVTAGVRVHLPALRMPGTPTDTLKSLLTGVAIGIGAYYCVELLKAALRLALDEPRVTSGFSQLVPAFPTETSAIVYINATAALAEEFVYRFLPLAYVSLLPISQKQQWRAFLAFSVLIFGMVHWQGGLAAAFGAFLYGWIFGASFWSSRNPLIVVCAHFSVNWLATIGIPHFPQYR